MGITDELREWAQSDALRAGMSLRAARDQALAIADRIDAEHEHELTMARGEAVNKTLEVMGDGYIALPKDADGVPIRIGDELEFSAFEIEKPVTRMVDGIGQGVFFAWCGERGYQQHEAKRYRHHHAPTVEDVLRGVVTLCHNTWKEESPFHFCDVDDVMESGNIADFAAKLQLKEEA